MATADVVQAQYEQLEEIARRFEAQAEAGQAMQRMLQQRVEALQGGGWIGQAADTFYTELEDVLWPGLTRYRDSLLAASQMVAQTVNILRQAEEGAASEFRQQEGISVSSAAARGVPDHGQVLGDSTARQSNDLNRISWPDKYRRLQSLEEQIPRLAEEERDDVIGRLRISGSISRLDEEIARLEAQRAEAEQSAEAWYNKIRPTWPLRLDSDGVPWRVSTDDYQDEIIGIDKNLQSLRAERENLITQYDALVQKKDQLAQLQNEQLTLRASVATGIAADGPSTKYPYFPGTIDNNCTKYASSKRYFPDEVNGNAFQWGEQARSAGYQTGEYPVKGSIMVMQPGIRGADSTNGHVAFVESVERQEDGSFKVTYSDNANHTPGPPMFIRPGEKGIEFIYEK